MSTLPEIESVLPKRTLTELNELERVVQRELDERRNRPACKVATTERKLGLHAGAWTVSEDFDAPLPDDFWLGNDA
jgi:hypothetical protein